MPPDMVVVEVLHVVVLVHSVLLLSAVPLLLLVAAAEHLQDLCRGPHRGPPLLVLLAGVEQLHDSRGELVGLAIAVCLLPS